MLIVNKGKKDYYDGVAGSTGIDKTIVYKRYPVEINKQKEMPKIFHHESMWRHNYKNPFLSIGNSDVDLKKSKKYEKAHSFIVGFCGKLYLGWKFHYKVKREGFALDENKTDIIYGYKNAVEYLRENYWKHNLEDDIKFIESYDPINIFREINAPVFIYDTDANKKLGRYGHFVNLELFIVNPILKDYEFYKVVDTFQAFQEIQMFLGGVLGADEKDITEIKDKYKISQHGFDKWSFRKESKK